MNPIIVALDVPTLDEATTLADAIGDSVGAFKVGLQLFAAEGPAAVRPNPRAEEEDDHERRPSGQPRVGLDAGKLQLAVDCRHHREGAVLEPQTLAWPGLDLACGESLKRALHSLEGVGGGQQGADVRFRQVERQVNRV